MSRGNSLSVVTYGHVWIRSVTPCIWLRKRELSNSRLLDGVGFVDGILVTISGLFFTTCSVSKVVALAGNAYAAKECIQRGQ